MDRKNKRGIQFNGNKLKIFLNIKRAELDMTAKDFSHYLKIPKDTIYSCIYNESMECNTYQSFKNRFEDDVRFQAIFPKTD